MSVGVGLGLPDVVAAPPVLPAAHGLRDSAIVVPEDGSRWELGFEYQAETCWDVSAWDPSCLPALDNDEAVPKSAAQGFGTIVPYSPFVLETAVTCWSGEPWEEFEKRALNRLDEGTSFGLEREFWTGALRGALSTNPLPVDAEPNFSLADLDGAVDVSECRSVLNGGTAVTARQGLALLQGALAGCAPGGEGFIHASPTLVTLWSEYLTDEDDRLVTKVKRNIVVAGGGYPDTGPQNVAAAAGTAWAFATGPVLLRLSDGEVLGDGVGENFTRPTNDVEARAERYAAVYTDPCRVFAILIELDL
jgi:hypothetical protein